MELTSLTLWSHQGYPTKKCMAGRALLAGYHRHQFYRIAVIVFIWGQFWPLGIVVALVCMSIPPYVNQELVYKMTHDLFKLESPNLAERCKIHWPISLFFGGWLPLAFIVKCQISLIINFKFICMTTHHLFKLGSPNLDQRCKITWLNFLFFCGGDKIW